MTAPGRTPPLVVWRYPLMLADRQTLRMPAGARCLSVGPPRDSEDLDLWALVDPARGAELREFFVIGTGNPMPPDAGPFIGTTYSHDRALIWHVFEAGGEER